VKTHSRVSQKTQTSAATTMKGFYVRKTKRIKPILKNNTEEIFYQRK
jgi:hypothetical protein